MDGLNAKSVVSMFLREWESHAHWARFSKKAKAEFASVCMAVLPGVEPSRGDSGLLCWGATRGIGMVSDVQVAGAAFSPGVHCLPVTTDAYDWRDRMSPSAGVADVMAPSLAKLDTCLTDNSFGRDTRVTFVGFRRTAF